MTLHKKFAYWLNRFDEAVAGRASESGDKDRNKMSLDCGEFKPYVPLYRGLLSELTRRQARESYDHLMSAKAERIEQLRALLARSGISLGPDRKAIQNLDDWFRVNVEQNPREPDRLENRWYAFVNDIALFLGEVMIAESPTLHWECHAIRERDAAYQKHVITGFSKVANPEYHADIDGLVATYGHQLISGDYVPPGFFVTVLDDAREKA